MRAWLAVACALLFAGVLASCGSSGEPDVAPAPAEPAPPAEPQPAATEPGESADAFVRRLLEYGYEREPALMWAELHPLAQQAVAESLYVDCALRYRSPVVLVSIETIRVYEEEIEAPGLLLTPSTAVSLDITLREGDKAPFSVISTLHAIALEGRWVWLPKPGALRAYQQGRCPTAEDNEAAS
jgi:hypothetical protein